MRLGISAPSDSVFAIQPFGTGGPSGCSFLSDVQLDSGRPAEVTRCQWITSGNTTDHGVSISRTWAPAFAPRAVALIGTTLPVGLAVACTFRPDGTVGTAYDDYTVTGDSVLGTVVALPSGVRIVVFLQPDTFTDACTGAMLSFYNHGDVSVADGAEFELGEFWVSDAVTLACEPGWSDEESDPTLIDQSEAAQPFTQRGYPARILRFTPGVRAQTDVYGTDAEDAAMDFEELFAKLDRGQQALYVPRWIDGAGAIDPRLANRTARIGTCRKLPGQRHISAGWFGHAECEVIEAPGLPAE